ncbi:unnamed protein product, partial [Ectocarpus sp. 12 AP-2014]
MDPLDRLALARRPGTFATPPGSNKQKITQDLSISKSLETHIKQGLLWVRTLAAPPRKNACGADQPKKHNWSLIKQTLALSFAGVPDAGAACPVLKPALSSFSLPRSRKVSRHISSQCPVRVPGHGATKRLMTPNCSPP